MAFHATMGKLNWDPWGLEELVLCTYLGYKSKTPIFFPTFLVSFLCHKWYSRSH